MKVKVLCFECGTVFHEEHDTPDITDQCPNCNGV